MSPALVLLLGALSLAVHLVLVLAVAPVLLARPGWPVLFRAGWRGSEPAARAAAAMVLAPWRALLLLLARQPVRFGADPLAAWAPILVPAPTLCAAMLAPSFSAGMATAPVFDLWSVAGLLLCGRLLGLLAACAGGIGAPGLAAVGGTVDLLLAAPGAILALIDLSIAAGGSGTAALLCAAHAASAPAAAALGLSVLAAGGDDSALVAQRSGGDLALFRFDRALRRVVAIDLVGALLWPNSLAVAASPAGEWLLAILCWLVRLGAGWAVLELAGTLLRSGAARRRLAGVSLLVGLLAPLLLLVGRSAE